VEGVGIGVEIAGTPSIGGFCIDGGGGV